MVVRELFVRGAIIYLITECRDFFKCNDNALGKYLLYQFKSSSDLQEMQENERNAFFKKNILKYVLKVHYQLEFNELDFKNNKYGKPFLKNVDEIFFNISHSADVYACAISKNIVGIDVQKIQTVSESVYDKFCTPEEIASILNASDRNAEFVKIWTKKEAYIKALGESVFITDLKAVDLREVHTERFDDFFMSVCAF